MPVHLMGVTIDGPLSRDLDDAVWLEEADGRPRVRVCIAEVSPAVPIGEPVDLRAREQGFTRYYANGNNPMLPRRLAEDSLSLLPDCSRRVVCIEMTLDDALDVEQVAIREDVLQSAAQLTYAQASEIAGGKAAPEHLAFAPALTSLADLAQRLMQKRRRRGELAFYDLRKGWATTEEGRLKPLKVDEANIGYVIVQELMLLANRTVAEFMLRANMPTLFRNHEARLAAPERDSLLHDIEAAVARPELYSLDTLSQRLNLTLSTARYSPHLKGHYGLNLPAYLHFTSPIRRYADLVNQRLLLAHLRHLPPPYTMEELETIGQELNALADEQRERRSAHYKRLKKAETERSLHAEAQQIANLPDKDVYRVLESAAERGKLPEAPVQAVRLRIRSDRVTVKELFCLLFVCPEDEAIRPLREEGLEWLRRYPEHAVSVLAIGTGLHGWKPVEYRYSGAFVCVASLDTEEGHTRSSEQHHGNKKKAQQKAALALCYALCGLELPAEDAPTKPVVKPLAGAKVAGKVVGPDWESLRRFEEAGDWISALYLACKKTNQKHPRFFYQKGDDRYHCRATVTWRGTALEGEAEAEVRQQAKQQAVRQLIEAIHALEGTAPK